MKHSSSDEHQGEDHVLEDHHQETVFVAVLGWLGASWCVNGQEGWEEGEDSWGGNRYSQEGSKDVDQGEDNLIPLEFFELSEKQFGADFLPADFEFGGVGFPADLASGDLDHFCAFHFLGDPVEDAILVDEGDAARALAEGDEGLGLFVADSASLFFDFGVLGNDFVG